MIGEGCSKKSGEKKSLSMQNKLRSVLAFGLKVLLFALPWHTIWITRQLEVQGSIWQQATLGYSAVQLFLWMLVPPFLVWFWKQKKKQTRTQFSWSADRLFALFILIFFLYLGASTLRASDAALAHDYVIRFLGASMLFFMLLIGPLSKKDILFWFTCGSILPSCLGVWQFLSQSTLASSWLGLALHPVTEAGTSIIAGESVGRWLRAYGSFPHPNSFGGYLALVSISSWLGILSPPKGKKKELLLMSYSLALVALFFTFSRSAWIAAALGLFMLMISQIKKQKRMMGILAVWTISIAGVLTAFFFPLVGLRLFGNAAHEVTSITMRVDHLETAQTLFHIAPVYGVGVGNYTVAMFEMNQTLAGWQLQPVHNVFWLLLVEMGFLGGVLLLGILGGFLRVHKAIARKYDWAKIFLWVLPLLSMLLLDHYLYTSVHGPLLFGLWSVLLLKPDEHKKRTDLHSLSP